MVIIFKGREPYKKEKSRGYLNFLYYNKPDPKSQSNVHSLGIPCGLKNGPVRPFFVNFRIAISRQYLVNIVKYLSGMLRFFRNDDCGDEIDNQSRHYVANKGNYDGN